MDERKARIGEFAAEHAPPGPCTPSGPCPTDPLARLDWQQRASHIGAYRELYGWDHDTEPVGPEPAGDSPEKRAAWHAASGAMNRTDNDRLRALPDGSLWHMRDTYRGRDPMGSPARRRRAPPGPDRRPRPGRGRRPRGRRGGSGQEAGRARARRAA